MAKGRYMQMQAGSSSSAALQQYLMAMAAYRSAQVMHSLSTILGTVTALLSSFSLCHKLCECFSPLTVCLGIIAGQHQVPWKCLDSFHSCSVF